MPLTFSRLTSGQTYIAGRSEHVAKARKDDDIALAERLALQFEPAVAKAVLQLLDSSADMLDTDALLEALQSGQPYKVLEIVDQAMAAAEAAMQGKLAYELQDVLWGVGIAVANTAPALVRAEFNFDRINPALGQWLTEYDLGLIRQINATTKESIRGVLIESMRNGVGPMAQARKVKDIISLTARQGAAVSNFRRELETFHTKRSAAGWGLGTTPDKVNGKTVFRPDVNGDPRDGILNRRLRDFRFDPSLQKALDTRKPLSPAKIDQMVAAYARRYRAYRAQTIARTESMRTANVGVQEAFRQAIEKGVLSEDLVRRRFILTKDERLCEVCAPIPGLNPPEGVKFAQPFATPIGPVMLGPIHPDCRCTVFIYTVEPQSLVVNGGG